MRGGLWAGGLILTLVVAACGQDEAPNQQPQAVAAATAPDFTRLISDLEYRPSWQTRDTDGQSFDVRRAHYVNRAQGLRAYFHDTGIDVQPRVDDGWQVRLGATELSRGSTLATDDGAVPEILDDAIVYRRAWGDERYTNGPAGTEQTFDVTERLPGHEPLELRLAVEADLDVSGGSVAVHVGARQVLTIDSLSVFDAASAEVPAWFEAREAALAILIDDRDAVYPLHIDPLLSAPWSVDPIDQNQSQFATSVAAAGDVNRDGLADLLVGAPFFDNGQNNEGRVYFYLGTAGFSNTLSATFESNTAGAMLGMSVASAGDVNEDGYSDVVLGAPYDGNGSTVGRAYVFYGGSGGLGADANVTLQGDQNSSQFGASVASAGDVNGDGRADVLVGAPLYDATFLDAGRTYLYLGGVGGLSAVAAWNTDGNQSLAEFGAAVASAGDVNGDGYSDVAVGGWRYDGAHTNEGLAVIYHGSGSGLAASPAWSATGNEANASFGVALAAAGDVNGDGYADLIVGADGATDVNGSSGRAYVFHGSGSGLVSSAAWTTSGGQPNSRYGAAVTGAGDINGDGYADVAIGAFAYDVGPSEYGRVVVYPGSASGLSTTPEWTQDGTVADEAFGRSVAMAGDLNGDGHADLLIGAHQLSNEATYEGRAYVYYGAGGTLATVAGWTSESNLAGAKFGSSVASAGDVNGDGYADVIIGAPNFDGGQQGEGAAFVFLGSSAGLAAGAAWRLESNEANASLGWAVAGAGDVNGDGYADVLVAAPDHDHNATFKDTGAVYGFYGSAAGLDGGAALSAASAAPWLGVVAPVAGYRRRYGYTIAGIGDVNGDGFSDVAVTEAQGGGYSPGLYTYHGSPTGLAGGYNRSLSLGGLSSAGYNYAFALAGAGDVNADGFDDMVLGQFWVASGGSPEKGHVSVYFGSGTGIPAGAGWSDTGLRIGGQLGNAVAAGDVNGDGYSDLVVGSHLNDINASEAGRAYVYYGGAALPSSPSMTLTTAVASARFGESVAVVGNVNGNSKAEFLVAACKSTNTASKLVVSLYQDASTTAAWQATADQNASAFGCSVASAGDVNGDGADDILIGASQYDAGQTDEGRVYLYYGNQQRGVSVNPRQVDLASGNLVQRNNAIRNSNGALRLLARAPVGRTKVKMQWEVKARGSLFDLTNLGESAAWVDIGTAGVSLDANLSSIAPGTQYHWRARLKTFPQGNFGRWYSAGANAGNEADFRDINDTAPPTVLSVRSTTANGTYGVGENIAIEVAFSEVVYVAGTPKLALGTTGPLVGTANYVSGHGTSTLTFTYAVAAGHNSPDLDYNNTLALAVTGAAIRDGAALDANLTLPATGSASSIAGQSAIVIDTAPIIVALDSSAANATYDANVTLPIFVTFSEPVVVAPSPVPVLGLDAGEVNATAPYVSGSGGNILRFDYLILPGHNSADLDRRLWPLSGLAFQGPSSGVYQGSIQDTDGVTHDADVVVPTPGSVGSLSANRDLVIDTAPIVLDVTSSANDGGYGVNGVVPIAVHFSENVTTTNTLKLRANVTPGGYDVACPSLASGSTLTCTYTVVALHNAADLDVASPIVQVGGVIKDLDGTQQQSDYVVPAGGAPGSLAYNKDIVIDTNATKVQGVTINVADGTYGIGKEILAAVVFDEAMFSTNAKLLLETGAVDAEALMLAGNGTKLFVFRYLVAEDELTSDLDYQSVAALSGTIVDVGGNAPTLTLPVPGAAGSIAAGHNVVIEAIRPKVTNVTSSTANGTYGTGATLAVTVDFSEPVVVTGSPQVVLAAGDVNGTAVYVSGTGTMQLVFSYTVLAGHNTLDLDYASQVALADGNITDVVGNAADRTFATPGAAGSLAANKNIVIDTAPVVRQVTSSDPNGNYFQNDLLTLQVVFSEPVTLTGGATLTLETGTSDAVVAYSAGSATETLEFVYTVQAGHESSDLDYVSTAALALSGGTLVDSVGSAAQLTLAGPGSSGSLADAKQIAIDPGPVINDIDSPTADGSYGIGQDILIDVNYSAPVTLSGGSARLALNACPTGGSSYAAYVSGSGTSTLRFKYTVGDQCQAPELDAVGTGALVLVGAASLKDAAGKGASLLVPVGATPHSLASNRNIAIDSVGPAVAQVTSANADGLYGLGSVLLIDVNYTDPVVVTGVPVLVLETGIRDANASYVSGSGSNILRFQYTVGAGDNSGDLEVVSREPFVLAGGTIRDTLGNNAGLIVPRETSGSLSANKDLEIDTVPEIYGVDALESDGTYGIGETLGILVRFTEPIIVSGVPELTLETNSTPDGVAYFIDGSGTGTLRFNYGIAPGERSLDLDYASTAALALAGGTIEDSHANPATITLKPPGGPGSLAHTRNLVIDTVIPTVVSTNATTPSGTYTQGDQIVIRIAMSEPVLVTGVPRLVLNATGVTAYAKFSTLFANDVMEFVYDVQAGQHAALLDYVSAVAVDLNGGSITDVGRNDADLTLPAPGGGASITASRTISIVNVPIAMEVTSVDANGTYHLGDRLTLQVIFSAPVSVTGSPKLALETGVVDANATYLGGSGSRTLDFNYTVAPRHNSSDLDCLSASSLMLLGGAILDLNGSSAVIALPTPGAAHSLASNRTLVIDTPPVVVNVSSPTPDGSYGVGSDINITVEFSENLIVSGSPSLGLENHAGGALVGSPTVVGNTLEFVYTVAAGDNNPDLDYLGSTALMAGGSIVDDGNNTADLTLPAPGAAGSLGANNNLVIDTRAPLVAVVTTSTADGYYRDGKLITFLVQFDENVTVTGTPTLDVNVTASALALYSAGSGSATLTFLYSIAAGEMSPDLDYLSASALVVAGASIVDLAGNDANVTLPVPGSAGSIAPTHAIVIDTSPPHSGAVADGNAIDIDAQATAVISANWGGFVDVESGIAEYTWAVGLNPGTSEIMAFTSVGLDTNASASGLGLVAGETYYVTVRAYNAAGGMGSAQSDGVLIDWTAPAAGPVNDGLTPPDIDRQSSTTSLSANWQLLFDNETGIADYQWAIGTTPGAADVQAWTSTGTSWSATATGLSLVNGHTYYVTVRAENPAGQTTTVTSDGIVVDTATPSIACDPALLQLAAVEGEPLAAQSLFVSNPGIGVLNWNAALGPAASWLSLCETSGVAYTHWRGVVPINFSTETLSAGSYSVGVEVTDPAALTSPQTCTVTVDVFPTGVPVLVATPGAVEVVAEKGVDPAPVALELRNIGSGSLNWSVSTSAGWLRGLPTSGAIAAAPASLLADITVLGLSAGEYATTLTLTSDAANTTVEVPVRLWIIDGSDVGLDVEPSALSATGAASGANPADEAMALAAVGSGALAWQARSACTPWLDINPSFGSAAPTDVTSATFGPATLAAGQYFGQAIIAASGSVNGSRVVPASLTLYEENATLLQRSPAFLRFEVDPAVATGAQTLDLWSSGPSDLNWTLTADATWLTLSPNTGTAAASGAVGTVDVNVDVDQLVAGDPTGKRWAYTATLTAVAPAAANGTLYSHVIVIVANPDYVEPPTTDDPEDDTEPGSEEVDAAAESEPPVDDGHAGQTPRRGCHCNATAVDLLWWLVVLAGGARRRQRA